MDTTIIEYGGNSITLLTLIEIMYNAVQTNKIEDILTITFKIYEKNLTHRIEKILSPLFVYAIFQSQCKRHKTEGDCKSDKKCNWNSTENICRWKYKPSLERDIVEAEEIINIEQSIKFFIIDKDDLLENAILTADTSSKSRDIISEFAKYLDDNLKLTKFEVDKRTVGNYAKLIKIGTEDLLDVNLINKKLFLQIFVSKISNYLKIWEQNITLSEDKSEKDRHNLKRLQILIENLTKFDSFCKKTEWLIDSIYKDRLSSFITVLKNIKLNAETYHEVSGGYEDWISTFIIHSLNCNLQLPYDIRYGIIAYKLVAMMRNLIRNHPSLFKQTGGMGETMSMTITQDRVDDVKKAVAEKEGIPEDQKRLIFGNTGQIFLPKNPNYSKIEAQHTAQKEQAIEEVKKLTSEELRRKRLERLGMIKSELEPQPELKPQNLKSMCKDIENIVDPQIYAKIRILKCGTVTEADIEDITRQLANLSLHPNEVKNVAEVKKIVNKITITQGTKVKSEVDSEESYGLDKLYSDEDLNTISKVTEVDSKDAPLVVTIVDESAKNNVSISLDNKFEDFGLANLFATTEEPPTPVPATPQAISAVPVVQARSAEPRAQAIGAVPLSKPISAIPPAPPSDVLLPKISIIIKEPPSDFGVQEITELPPKPKKSEEPKKPMSRYQKLYALANSVSNMVTSSLDIMHPYNGIIKYKDILIKTYEAPRKDIAHFFEYILKGLKLVIIEVPRLCYNLIQLLLVSLYDFVNTGIINVETFLNNIYETISKYFVNTIGKISNMCIVGIFTYCIPAITDLYRYLRYNIVPIPLKFIELSKDKFVIQQWKI